MTEKEQIFKQKQTYYKLEIAKICDCDTPIIKLNIIDHLLFDIFNQCHYDGYYITVIGKFRK